MPPDKKMGSGKRRQSWNRMSGSYNLRDRRCEMNPNNSIVPSYHNYSNYNTMPPIPEYTGCENYGYLGYENRVESYDSSYLNSRYSDRTEYNNITNYCAYENPVNFSNNRESYYNYQDAEDSTANCSYNIEYRNWDYNSLCSRCRRTIDDLDDNIVMPEVVRDRENCIKCFGNIGDFYYRGTSGWLCQKCCTPRRSCINKDKGCTYEDLNVKMWKHELYFCLFLEKCHICMLSIEIGTLYEHYSVHHANETVSEGSKFRVKNKGPFEYAPHIEFIILADFGPAVCTFYLKDGLFRIGVHAPIHFSELHKYKCVFEISEPYWKTKTTYIIRETYLELRDWNLIAHKNDFAGRVPWTEKADIAITITRNDQ